MESKSSSLMRNTLILTMATFISKFLGFIYVIPFTSLVGTQGFALYMYAYRPYTIMLSIATAGLPLAVSKFVSKYNQLGDYHTGRRLMKTSLIIMSITGFVAFLILYNLSPLLASFLIGKDDQSGNSISDVIMVMRTVSFALIIVPILSISRGFFQGYNSMEPTGVSQVIEQIVRIIWILVGGFIVVRLLDRNVSVAAGVATFGAFSGALAGLFVIYYYWKKQRSHINNLYNQSTIREKIPLGSMYKELFAYAIPFVLVGLAIPFYQLIDTFMVNKLYMSIGYTLKKSETINSVLGLTQTLVLIPVSLATALSLSLIPSITRLYTANEIDPLRKQVTQTFQMLFFVTLPAVVGLSVLSKSAYITFFGIHNAYEIGSIVLRWYSPVALLFAMFSVTAAMLQGIDKQRLVIVGLGIGVIFKVIFNFLLVSPFRELGPVFATYIGYTISVVYNLWVIKKYLNYNYTSVIKRILFMFILVIIMGAVAGGISYLLNFLNVDLRIKSVVIVLICGLIGAYLYLVLSMKTGLIKLVFGKEPALLKKIVFKSPQRQHSK
ncbi:polysaccharide biosynthesis protein [Priestia megaterium]|uniref:putative polysaccharide biosynthesis protein n=1 Tax=Priestia megaterium TaxID=1404 RepID=UPI002281B5B3|nr:polysaccharide biosynthesis protein [Priestia megaterium]MCY9021025.1 polysaccharide biosynthesis protein [Priestia megaterium]MCY9024059.1 polysaccharide biosynthesis protein [Priestia megaterium]